MFCFFPKQRKTCTNLIKNTLTQNKNTKKDTEKIWLKADKNTIPAQM